MSPFANLKRWLGAGGDAGGNRWVVLDVETSGLDPHHDRLLAIAATAVQREPAGEGGERDALHVVIGDSFEVVLAQPGDVPVDKGNILLHGIGVGAQRAGVPAEQALHDFERFVAGAPMIGFHVAFDAAMIERTMRERVGRGLQHPRWLDLEPLAAVLLPEVAKTLEGRSLDDWMGHFGIDCLKRHAAAADTLATAELLLRLWPHARRQGARDFRGLQKLAAHRKWVSA